MPIRVVPTVDPDPVPDPIPDPVPDPTPVPDPAPELTPEQHAQAAWSWLQAKCAPSTWTAFTHSVAVRVPESKGWTGP